jgi:hypothetical protein
MLNHRGVRAQQALSELAHTTEPCALDRWRKICSFLLASRTSRQQAGSKSQHEGLPYGNGLKPRAELCRQHGFALVAKNNVATTAKQGHQWLQWSRRNYWYLYPQTGRWGWTMDGTLYRSGCINYKLHPTSNIAFGPGSYEPVTKQDDSLVTSLRPAQRRGVLCVQLRQRGVIHGISHFCSTLGSSLSD